ncbi:Oidioi.mRNA.OKI2018_I69.chr1.g2734.t1.cds [Oikopleura dioica]|uniref:Oidioi.mRNA.OKI2018_I69.chr1.g2734.t1.cds n=1 Tax=Oikopleura dioica TaxID=34765 RepID=A0ABN7T158_OIKDI|nr:Oidioi.mRNA.OKI2018_I69.chr1.g2734.t1.cds [Oikopleura dioica]
MGLLFRKQSHSDVFYDAARVKLYRASTESEMTVYYDDDGKDVWLKISNIDEPSNLTIENLLSICFKKLVATLGHDESKITCFDIIFNENELFRIDSIKIANFQLNNVLKQVNIKLPKKRAIKRKKAESSVSDNDPVGSLESDDEFLRKLKRAKTNTHLNKYHTLNALGILFKNRNLQNDFYKRCSAFLNKRSVNIQMTLANLEEDNPCDFFCHFISTRPGGFDKLSTLMISTMMTTVLADIVMNWPEKFLDPNYAADNTYDVITLVRGVKKRENDQYPIHGFNVNNYLPVVLWG